MSFILEHWGLVLMGAIGVVVSFGFFEGLVKAPRPRPQPYGPRQYPEEQEQDVPIVVSQGHEHHHGHHDDDHGTDDA